MSFYSSLLRKFILRPLLAYDNMSSALAHYSFLQKSQFWSRQQLLDFQWECLKKLLRESYDNTEYYRTVMDERGLTPDSFKSFDDLTKLPVLTRDITYNKKEQMISKRYNKENLQQVVSGGTTGQQAKLFREPESAYIKHALSWRHETWMGRYPCDKMAYIWPAAMDVSENEPFRTRFKNRYLHGFAVYLAGRLDKKSVEYIQQDILKYKPKFIKAFPSALFGFTEYCLAHDMQLPKVNAIMSTGEPLYPNQQKMFNKAYNCPTFDMYGSRETGNNASECDQHHGMHIAMETSCIEFVDNNKSVEYGTEGEMLITDLTNFSFPLIRYAINDFGVPLKDECPCGRGLIMMDKALGRLSDNIYRPDGTKILGPVIGIALTFEGPPIGQTQVIQKTLTDFVVKITDKPKPTKEIFDYIETEMKRLISDEINIKIDVVNEIEKEKSGKVRYVKSEIDNLNS